MFLAAVGLLCAGLAAQAEGPKRLVAYYLYSDRTKTPPYSAKNIPYKKLTHLIHVAVVVNAAGDGSVDVLKDAVEPELIPKAHAANVRVLLCVQGPSQVFKQIAEQPESRAKFATALKEFVQKNDYDGVDIDWEVPQGAVEVANNVAMMQALRDTLPAPRYLLSMATTASPGPGRWGEFDFKALLPIVDFFNVMTYDFHGPWVRHAGHNSPLFPSGNDQGHEGSIDESMNLYLNQLGVPPEKINLGTAFYGYESPAADLNALCDCEKTTYSREYGSYIKMRASSHTWTAHVDGQAMAPYLVGTSGSPSFLTYDDVESTKRKVIYALEVRELGGVFMWELSGDFDGKRQDLLDAMYSVSRRAEKHK